MRIFQKIKRFSEERRAIRELSALDDHVLRDLAFRARISPTPSAAPAATEFSFSRAYLPVCAAAKGSRGGNHRRLFPEAAAD